MAGNIRNKRAAVTGLGIVSCLGNDVLSVAQALKEGRSGIICDQERREK